MNDRKWRHTQARDQDADESDEDDMEPTVNTKHTRHIQVYAYGFLFCALVGLMSGLKKVYSTAKS